MILSLLALILSFSAITLQFLPQDGGVSNAIEPSGAPMADRSSGVASLAQSKPPGAAESDPTALSASDRLLEEQSRRIAGLERQVAQLGQVIRASGLDVAPSFANGPPGGEPWLASMGEQYANRARFDESRKKMAERASAMRQRDLETYGADSYQRISELSEKARPRRGNESQSERSARESALNSLMTDYPESWATSVAVAEQALDAAMNRNSQGAEMYYQSLIGTSPYPEVVTEQGIDAIPTLQTYLARQYVQEGRYEEASAIIDALSVHADSVIVEPNDMGEPTTKPVRDIVTDLRASIAR
ncbi:hypothetical protein CKO27_07440 [Thiocystis violacea]|nr:hypothetical protein [Thiocystis violacea]